MLKLEQNIVKTMQRFDKIIFNSKKFNTEDTIVLAGSPRSGTTWLMEILGNIPGYTYLFEPLNPLWYPESFKVGFRSRTYLPNNVDWIAGENYLKKIFTGRLLYAIEEEDNAQKKINGRLSNLIPLSQLKPQNFMPRLLSNKLVVKFIRLNRLLPWVVERFQLRSIVFIIRHPCAVVASQFKTGFYGYHPDTPPYTNIFPNLENVLNEASKIEGLDPGLLSRLRRIETREEILAAVWCLDNYIPLSLPKLHPWILVTYEKLVRDGEKEITRLFNEIGEKNIPRAVFRLLKKPGMLVPKTEFKTVINEDKQLPKWKKSLSKEQIERILKIVSDFGLDFYTEDLEPDYRNISVKDI